MMPAAIMEEGGVFAEEVEWSLEDVYNGSAGAPASDDGTAAAPIEDAATEETFQLGESPELLPGGSAEAAADDPMNDTYFGEAFGVAAANAAVKGAEPDNDALFEGWLGRVLPSPGAKVLSRNATKSFQSGCTISGDKARITGITLRMAVSQDYAAGDYQTNSIPKRVTDAVTRINGIISDNAARSDLDKLNAYADEICGLVEYNWPAVEDDLPYGDPWQLVCIFDGDPDTKVVCEGYSKGLKYLIDLSTFQDSRVGCVLMIGDLSDLGGHMWNVISMPDGRYYLADLTNCDGGDHCTGTLFLKASTGNAGGPYKCGGLTYTLYDSIKARFGADSPWLKLSRADYGEEEPPEPSTEINPDWTALNDEFVMTGGVIKGNTSPYGGGVYIRDGSMVMKGGERSATIQPSERKQLTLL